MIIGAILMLAFSIVCPALFITLQTWTLAKPVAMIKALIAKITG